MKLETIVTLIMLTVAIAAGFEQISFWWAVLPAFFAGSLALSNGPHYPRVIEANQRGVIWYFPAMLAIYVAGKLILAGITFAIASWIA